MLTLWGRNQTSEPQSLDKEKFEMGRRNRSATKFHGKKSAKAAAEKLGVNRRRSRSSRSKKAGIVKNARKNLAA